MYISYISFIKIYLTPTYGKIFVKCDLSIYINIYDILYLFNIGEYVFLAIKIINLHIYTGFHIILGFSDK